VRRLEDLEHHQRRLKKPPQRTTLRLLQKLKYYLVMKTRKMLKKLLKK